MNTFEAAKPFKAQQIRNLDSNLDLASPIRLLSYEHSPISRDINSSNFINLDILKELNSPINKDKYNPQHTLMLTQTSKARDRNETDGDKNSFILTTKNVNDISFNAEVEKVKIFESKLLEVFGNCKLSLNLEEKISGINLKAISRLKVLINEYIELLPLEYSFTCLKIFELMLLNIDALVLYFNLNVQQLIISKDKIEQLESCLMQLKKKLKDVQDSQDQSTAIQTSQNLASKVSKDIPIKFKSASVNYDQLQANADNSIKIPAHADSNQTKKVGSNLQTEKTQKVLTRNMSGNMILSQDKTFSNNLKNGVTNFKYPHTLNNILKLIKTSKKPNSKTKIKLNKPNSKIAHDSKLPANYQMINLSRIVNSNSQEGSKVFENGVSADRGSGINFYKPAVKARLFNVSHNTNDIKNAHFLSLSYDEHQVGNPIAVKYKNSKEKYGQPLKKLTKPQEYYISSGRRRGSYDISHMPKTVLKS